jgi:hypothetical protein
MKHDVQRMLSEVNPVRAERLGDAVSTPAANLLLERILSQTPERAVARPVRRAMRRRVVIAGAAAVVIASGVAVFRLPFGPGQEAVAYAATPPMLDYRPSGQAAAGFLRDLADRVAGMPDRTGSGDFSYIRMQSWLLVPTVDATTRTGGAAVASVQSESWVTADGSGRLVRQPGPLIPQADQVTLPPGSTVAEATPDGAASPGAQSVSDGQVLDPLVDLASLPTDSVGLARRLDALPPSKTSGDARSEVPSTAWRLGQLRGIWSSQPVPSRTQAAFLRLLADTPMLTDEGTVTDRVGRPGHAVAFDSQEGNARVRQVVILDPSTGATLGFEKILLTEQGREQWSPFARLHLPAVVQYDAYFAAGRVPSVEVHL